MRDGDEIAIFLEEGGFAPAAGGGVDIGRQGSQALESKSLSCGVEGLRHNALGKTVGRGRGGDQECHKSATLMLFFVRGDGERSV